MPHVPISFDLLPISHTHSHNTHTHTTIFFPKKICSPNRVVVAQPSSLARPFARHPSTQRHNTIIRRTHTRTPIRMHHTTIHHIIEPTRTHTRQHRPSTTRASHCGNKLREARYRPSYAHTRTHLQAVKRTTRFINISTFIRAAAAAPLRSNVQPT